MTGLSVATARFQAASAFTGTGFTTGESESIVNFPLRRQIISILMAVGNVGIVGLASALIVSMLSTNGNRAAVATQLLGICSGLILLWVFMLNKWSDRVLCSLLKKLLANTSVFKERKFYRILQLGSGYSVCEHPVDESLSYDDRVLFKEICSELELKFLAVHTMNTGFMTDIDFQPGSDDKIVLFGPDSAHEMILQEYRTRNSAQGIALESNEDI